MNEIRVNTGFGDPVKGNVKLATYGGNAFYGYYGYGRTKGNDKHCGFDYAVNKGTEVIAVGLGKIAQVRIGPKYKKCYTYDEDRKEYIKDKELFECPLLELIESNDFSDNYCKSCPGKKKYQLISQKTDNSPAKYKAIHDLCYGVQVWLKLDNTDLYAYYAHLSALSKEVKELIEKYLKKGETTAIFEDKCFNKDKENDPRIVKKKGLIGNSGRTGVASGVSWPDHLHFECRKGLETGTQISPNNIVRTQFLIMINKKHVFDSADDTTVWTKQKKILQDKWRTIFRNIGKVDTYLNYSEKAIYYTHNRMLPSGVHPCNDITDIYKSEVVSSEGEKSIAPYQIIKKSKEYSIGGEMSCTYGDKDNNVEENDNVTCDNQTDRMPWRSDLSESCQCVSSNNQTNQMQWQ